MPARRFVKPILLGFQIYYDGRRLWITRSEKFVYRRPSDTIMTQRHRHTDTDLITGIEIKGRGVVEAVIAFDTYFSVMIGLVIELLI